MARETPDGAGAIDIDELYITLAGNVVIDLREFFQNIKI